MKFKIIMKYTEYNINNYSSMIEDLKKSIDLVNDGNNTYILSICVEDVYKSYSFNNIDLKCNGIKLTLEIILSEYSLYYGEVNDFKMSLRYKEGHTIKTGISVIYDKVNEKYVYQMTKEECKNILTKYHYINKNISVKYTVKNTFYNHIINNYIYEGKELVLTFVDYLNPEKGCVIRVCNNITVEFKIEEDKNLTILDFYKKYDKLHSLSQEVKDLKIKVETMGIIDIETLVINNKLYPYSIGIYYNNKFKCFYLSDYNSPTGDRQGLEKSINNMIKDCFEYISKKKIKLLYAHNGGKFDFKLLLEYGKVSNDNKDIDKDCFIQNCFIKGTTIYYITIYYKEFKFTFKDSYLLLPRSLKDLCKAFNTDVIKGDFPHK